MPQIINIDTEDNLDQILRVTIESNLYIFRLRYNDRSKWQLSLYDADLYDISLDDNTQAKLYGEKRLMPSQDFFKYTHEVETLPTGYLFLYDTENPAISDIELPDRYNLGQGKRFILVYFTKTEFEEEY